MALEVNSDKVVCTKCGIAYSRRKGYFSVSYAENYKGIGYIPVCKNCVDNMYSKYLSQCSDTALATRQVCRKLDLYWNENIFKSALKKSSTRTIMTQYIIKINSVSCVGKSYDDTLLDEGTFWAFKENKSTDDKSSESSNHKETESKTESTYVPTEEVISFWGSNFTPDMYEELEQRRTYWMSKLPEGVVVDIGTEAIIRQICNLEIDINKARVQGKPIDKSVNALNSLLGSASLKPTQRKDDIDSTTLNTPLGVWLYKFECERPLPDIDDSLKDVNKLKKYIFTWMGHLCKMLGVKNGYTRLYEAEIQRLRVEKPIYDDEDDEDLLIDVFNESESDNTDGGAVVAPDE